MPRGKYVRKNKRNENALTTQLMRISLRTDDHIYSDRPIATAEAARFLQEIAALKLQCPPTNTRALQVIEKLTRIMRNIVTEENISQASSSFNNYFSINYELIGSASPVYSLPDEDRSMDTYEVNNIHPQINISHGKNERTGGFERTCSLEHDALNDIKQFKVKTYSFDDEISRKEIYKGRQIEFNASNQKGYITIPPEYNTKYTVDNCNVIDITSDSDMDETNDIVTVSEDQYNAIEHVNSGISNMVIDDKLSDQLNPVDNCSQSILDDFANDNNTAANKTAKVIKKQSPKEKEAKATIVNNVNNYFQKETLQSSIHLQDIFASSQSATVEWNISKTVSQGVVGLENNKMGMDKNIGNEKEKPKKRRTKKSLQSDETNATNTPLKNLTNKRCNNKVNRPKPVKRSKKPKIYNENVENDLSWVENIRYVREIDTSEYDPALSTLQDNFWDNFELPGSWSDLDFEV